jgi:hypothetical protein
MVKRRLMSYVPGIMIMNRVVHMKFMVLFLFAALSVAAQSNPAGVTNDTGASSLPATQPVQSQTNQSLFTPEQIQEAREACIQSRRCICGRILKIFPDGLVIDSGYTNLLRAPLTHSWLVPGSVTASRAPALVEGNEPDSVCVGLVFLTDVPKAKRFKPKPRLYDYVIIQGYPAGERTYTSVGTIQRTVRRFTTILNRSVYVRLMSENETSAPAAKVQ